MIKLMDGMPWLIIQLRKSTKCYAGAKNHALNPAVNNKVWYEWGFNYQITGKTKLMTDLKTQKSPPK
jgi:hypothetical protein